MSVFHFSNLLIHLGRGTTCCAPAEMSTYFSFYLLLLTKSIFLFYFKKRLPILFHKQKYSNEIEALSLIELGKPDIAFLDIKMPGITGIDVAKKVSCCSCLYFSNGLCLN
jgi:CheY-like chemotaxis protein